jgi:hypothetical protein
MKSQWGVLLSILGLIWMVIAVPHAASDGGFFWPSVSGVYQNAERVIFTVNGDGTITIVLGISYEGEAEEFSWVFPVPSIPELAVTETETLELLEAATVPQMEYPRRFCDNLRTVQGGLGGGGPELVAAGGVGPYDYVVLGGDAQPDALTEWLREHGYQVPEEIEPVIATYVEQGMYFLAMRLRQDSATQDIQPIVITYEADRVVFPIRMTAVAAVEDMPIKIWIFADEQYVPTNYAHPTPDFSRFRAASRVANIGFWHSHNNATSYGLSDELERQQALNGDHVFLTRFAGPSGTLLVDERYFWDVPTRELIRENAFLMDLITRFPYLTYLWTSLSPEQMTLDPIFEADSSAQDVSYVIDLTAVVDPLTYWGCSSAWALSDEQWANLPAKSTHFADFHLDVVHPPDWGLSVFEYESESKTSTIHVYSPEAVDRSTLDAFFAGEDTPPMFLFARGIFPKYDMGYWWDRQEAFRAFFDLPFDNLPFDETRVPAYIRSDHEPEINPRKHNTLPGVLVGMLASEEDWETDGSLYELMLAYARSYQFYRAPELRHTLFLDGHGSSLYTENVQVPYPEDWEVFFSKQRPSDIMIKPQDFIGEKFIPYVRLIPLREVVAPIIYLETSSVLDSALDWLWETYHLPDEEREAEWRHAIQCEGEALPFSSEHPVKSGWVKLTSGFVIEYSAPAEYLERYGETLQLMAENTPSGISCE